MTIQNTQIQIKEWNGQRVVTFKDIDTVHQRPEGTARKRFADNKEHLIENEDYFMVKKSDVLMSEKRTLDFIIPNRGITFLTESGYLLLVKSFTDDLAWKVQRQLINSYFKCKQIKGIMQPSNTTMENLLAPLADIKTMYAQVNHIEDTMNELSNVLAKVINYTTINYQQQNELLQLARERVNYLLGGAKSPLYKKRSRTYFKNLWLNFCDVFACDSYKNLNPLDFDYAKDWILEWNYHVR